MKTVLMGRPRYVVRYWNSGEPGKGRVVRDETLAGRPPQTTQNGVLGAVVTYQRQADGAIHVISRELVKDVIIEQADKYEDWHKIGTHNLDRS